MMRNRSRLLSVLAHPDDASLGTGGILAKYAAEGLETYLVTATRDQRRWAGSARGCKCGPPAGGAKLDYMAPMDGDLFAGLR